MLPNSTKPIPETMGVIVLLKFLPVLAGANELMSWWQLHTVTTTNNYKVSTAICAFNEIPIDLQICENVYLYFYCYQSGNSTMVLPAKTSGLFCGRDYFKTM